MEAPALLGPLSVRSFTQLIAITYPLTSQADPEAFQRNRTSSFSRFKDAFEKLYPTDDPSPLEDQQPTVQALKAHKIFVRDFAYERNESQAPLKPSMEAAPSMPNNSLAHGQKRGSEDFDHLARERSRARLE